MNLPYCFVFIVGKTIFITREHLFPMKRRVHIVVHGHVQGVCFRSAVRDKAELEGVSGWVRNCCDGTVEAVFEGNSPALDRVIDYCRKSPLYSRVDSVDLNEETSTGKFHSFTIRY